MPVVFDMPTCCIRPSRIRLGGTVWSRLSRLPGNHPGLHRGRIPRPRAEIGEHTTGKPPKQELQLFGGRTNSELPLDESARIGALRFVDRQEKGRGGSPGPISVSRMTLEAVAGQKRIGNAPKYSRFDSRSRRPPLMVRRL